MATISLHHAGQAVRLLSRMNTAVTKTAVACSLLNSYKSAELPRVPWQQIRYLYKMRVVSEKRG